MIELLWMSRSAERALVTVEGFNVPNVEVYRIYGGPEDGKLSISLLRHGGAFMSMDVDSEDELKRWMPFLANCMATAAGYSCFGKNSQSLNPYKSQAHAITNVNDSDEFEEPTV